MKYEMLPSRLQYSKEYNYKPWILTRERVNIRDWKVFGGPYDMAYPPLAVLRHDPDNQTARIAPTLWVLGCPVSAMAW